jgi:hypothetical protein
MLAHSVSDGVMILLWALLSAALWAIGSIIPAAAAIGVGIVAAQGLPCSLRHWIRLPIGYGSLGFLAMSLAFVQLFFTNVLIHGIVRAADTVGMFALRDSPSTVAVVSYLLSIAVTIPILTVAIGSFARLETRRAWIAATIAMALYSVFAGIAYAFIVSLRST